MWRNYKWYHYYSMFMRLAELQLRELFYLIRKTWRPILDCASLFSSEELFLHRLNIGTKNHITDGFKATLKQKLIISRAICHVVKRHKFYL